MSNLTQEQIKRIKEYLGRKLSEGKLILFTGAGFSSNVKDKTGKNLPLSNELAQEIAQMINLKDPNASLKDVFYIAQSKMKNTVNDYLKNRLNVDTNSINDTYKTLINQPWYKAYTLNIDNLFIMAQLKFNFDRRIICISSNTNNQKNFSADSPKNLTVIHINGMLEDIPDKITFSQEQYSERMTFSDSYYSILASEILQYPFIFFGSKLDEDLLWKYIYLKKQKGFIRTLRELRPRSFIVIPELSPSRQALLKEYNISWIPQTCEEFADTFLRPLEAESRKGFIKIEKDTNESTMNTIPIVSDLISSDNNTSSRHYLLGAEPSWKDICSNSTIERDKEKEWIQEIMQYTEKIKANSIPKVFILTGTAGDGKTSIAMRLAFYLTNKQQTVGWIDRNSNIYPDKIKDFVENTENLEALFIDTPDMYGPIISQVISNLALKKTLKFIVLIIRSSKVDNLIKAPLFDNTIPTKEFNTYKLTDNEINKILDLLEMKNLIGALKGKDRKEQIDIFKSKSDRQLIVAMIEATSGKDFSKKICEEFEQLENDSKSIYCLLALATVRHCPLFKEEILLGIGENRDNSIINVIDKLVRRGLLIENNNKLKVRHRVVAETVYKRLSLDNQLMLYYTRLAYVAAIKSINKSREKNRMERLLKKIINHETLFKISPDPEDAEKLYESIAHLLTNNHHFLLQRGCFELQRNNLDAARNYLNQSFNLKRSDALVKLSLEHLNFKEAIANPNTEQAFKLAENAYDTIIELIDKRGKWDPYPYHVLGTQGLLWAKKGIKDITERKKYLETLLATLKKGVENHPRSDKLKEIRDKVQSEIFHFFVKN